MYLKLLLLGLTFIKTIGVIESFSVQDNLNSFDCETTCKVARSHPEFDPRRKLCKCILPDNADDTDMALLTKKGNLIGKTAARISDRVVVLKREANNEDNKPDETHPIVAEENLKADAIVGQAAPFSLKKPTQLSRKLRAKVISQEQQSFILKQIRDRLSHFERAGDTKTRQGDIDAVINYLKQLSNTALQPQTRSAQPQLKLRSLMENSKNKRKERRDKLLKLSNRTGIGHQKTDKNEALRDAAIKDIFSSKSHFELVTQDPKLVDK